MYHDEEHNKCVWLFLLEDWMAEADTEGYEIITFDGGLFASALADSWEFSEYDRVYKGIKAWLVRQDCLELDERHGRRLLYHFAGPHSAQMREWNFGRVRYFVPIKQRGKDKMARVYGIKKELAQNNVNKKTIKGIIGNGNLINVIERMENSLDSDMLHQILDSNACGGGKEFIERCKKTGKEIADKTLSEKIAHVNKISSDSEKIILNADNTLSATWSFDNNGKYKCVCSAAVKTGVRVSDIALENNNAGDCVMPLSYCYCCAGSGRRHLQLQLGVELKTKEVISSPINSKGEKACEFIFEIVR